MPGKKALSKVEQHRQEVLQCLKEIGPIVDRYGTSATFERFPCRRRSERGWSS